MAKQQGQPPERIISKLHEADISLARSTTIAQVCKHLAVTEQTYYR